MTSWPYPGLSPALDLEQSPVGEEESALRRRLWAGWRGVMEGQSWRSTPRGPRRDHGLTEIGVRGFALSMRLAGLHVRGKRNALAVRRTELELICPGLPEAFENLRILHVTDPHFDLCPGVVEAIAEAVAGFPADLCVMTGDYRAACDGPHGAAMSDLRRLVGHIQAPEGIWATLGNHDCAAMAGPMEEMGITLLANEQALLTRGRACLRLVGLDDVHRFHTPLADEALERHAPARDGVFSILLVHSAELAGRAACLGYGLYLCGHSHGGQVALPGGRPLMTHMDSHRRQARGLWRIHGMHGYTSPGAGTSGVPLRYFTHSEVTRLTLRRPRPTAML